MDVLSKGTGKNGELQNVWDTISVSVFEAEMSYREIVCTFQAENIMKLTELQNWKGS